MSSMKQAAAEGACLTCLDQGTVKFPLDPYAHTATHGHWPVLAENAPMMSQSGAVPAPGGPMTDPRGSQAKTPSLRSLYLRRIRNLKLAERALALMALAIIVASVTVLPAWWALALLPVLYVRGCVITTARELIRNMSHPLFYLAEISHDLR